MADLLEAVRAKLIADATIYATVGGKVRPEERPQSDDLPAITYSLIDMDRPHHLNDGSFVGLADALIQFDCWANDRGTCVDLKTRIEAVFDGWIGTQDGVEVVWCGQVAEIDLDEPPEPGSDDAIYHTAVDYRFKFRGA